jgi:hypothetical protein
MANYQFSRRTIIAAVIVLERMTHADLSGFLLTLGPDLVSDAGGESISLKKRVNNIISIVDQHPDRQVDDGSLLRDALVEKAVSLIQSSDRSTVWMAQTPRPDAAALTRALVLLRHKCIRLFRAFLRAQHGHRGTLLASARINLRRIVAIELGM